MKIIVLSTKKLYPVFTFVKLTAIFLVLIFSSTFAVNCFLNSPLYVAAANNLGCDKIIILDAGHGGEDCGAIGTNGVFEKTLNLEIAQTIAGMLGEKGYAVVLTRTEDKLLYTESENIKGISGCDFCKHTYEFIHQRKIFRISSIL